MDIKLFTTHGYNHLYTVIVDGLFADHLTADEALGVVASALFSKGKPIYVRSYEDWIAWNKAYKHEEIEIAGLLT